MRDTVPVHGRHESDIMRGFALYSVLKNKLVPAFENGSFIAKQMKLFHDCGNVVLRISDCQTKAILGNRARRNYPIFVDYLRNNTRNVAPQSCRPHGS